MRRPIIEVKNLKKYFQVPNGYLHAVDNVSFALNEGCTLGVVGESGCGKSTLGRVILHLLEPTSGSIFYKGEDITNITQKQLHNLRREMQIIFQDPFSSLNPRMTVQELISEPLKIYKLYQGVELSKKVAEIMDTVGIAERFRNAYPHELDGGRRQRIGIGRALALEPSFVVCDEPVSALDVSIQAQVLNLMQDLQEDRGLSYLFITHDLSVVRHISDEICVMYLGQLVEKASTTILFENPLHPYTQALLSAIPIADIDKPVIRIKMKGELSSPINPKPGCRFAPRCPNACKNCFTDEPKLIEVAPDHLVACHFVGQNLTQ